MSIKLRKILLPYSRCLVGHFVCLCLCVYPIFFCFTNLKINYIHRL